MEANVMTMKRKKGNDEEGYMKWQQNEILNRIHVKWKDFIHERKFCPESLKWKKVDWNIADIQNKCEIKWLKEII